MKKLNVLILLLCLFSSGVWADTSNYKSEIIYGFYGKGDLTFNSLWNLNAGELASILTENEEDSKNKDARAALIAAENIKISATTQLNDADLKALSLCTSVVRLDLDKANLAEGASISNLTTTAQYISLPDEVTEISAETLTGCTKVKSAVSVNMYEESNSYYQLVGYVSEGNEGSLNEALYLLHYNRFLNGYNYTWAESQTKNQYDKIAIKKAKFYGSLNAADISQGATTNANKETLVSEGAVCALNGASFTEIDLTNAVFNNAKDLSMLSNYGGSLTTLYLPTSKKVTEIPDYMLNGCSLITSLRVSDNFTTIGASAFAGCSSLNTIALSSNLESIGTSAFSGLPFTKIVDTAAPEEMEEGVCYMPSCVTLGNSAFAQCTSLVSSILPDNMTSIGNEAFSLCTVQKSVILSNSLQTIGTSAFAQNAFESIVFPASLTYIATKAFSLTRMKDVYFLGLDAPTVENGAFDDTTYMGNNSYDDSKTETIDQKKYATREAYKTAAGWVGMLHLNPNMTDEQRAKYTDITRGYRCGVSNNYGEVENAGSETTTLTSSNYGDCAKNVDWGFRDKYVGEGYIWPSQSQMLRAYVTAYNGVLWDGTTTFDNKYIGLHEFVLISYDAVQTNPKEWEFSQKGGDWYTICVPFNMTKAQVAKAFKGTTQDADEVKVRSLGKVVRDEKQESIKLFFGKDYENNKEGMGDDEIVIKAHMPYLIYPTAPEGETLTLPYYEMQPGSPLSTNTVTAVAADGETKVYHDEAKTDPYTYTFIGNYNKMSQQEQTDGSVSFDYIYLPDYCYYLGVLKSTKKSAFFFKTSKTKKWNPFTAIIYARYGQDDSSFKFDESTSAKIIMIFDEDDTETTGIESVETTTANTVNDDAIYNINGQRVNASNLSKGLYIKNGKKFIVK